MPVLQSSASLLRALLPASVAIHEWHGSEPDSLIPPLFPEERAAVDRAVAKRVREFAQGRHCARQALSRWGLGHRAIPQGPGRAPTWPAGMTGSITHTDGYCAAAVAERGVIAALGIDAELLGRADPALWPAICTAHELAELTALPAPSRDLRATMIFSAKEAFYKCQYAITGAWVDFQDVEVVVADSDGHFALRPLTPLVQSLVRHWPLTGRFGCDGARIISAIHFSGGPVSPS